MRLDQFLVKSNICSRTEAKKYIKSGRVIVNGVVAKDSSAHIDEKKDEVLFDNLVIEYSEFHYYMLNKPAGCVTATRDGLSATVIDLLKGEPVKDLFPVGRLDKDTEGLLIITDDGKLAHELLSPKKHVEKCYYVISNKQLTPDVALQMETGLDIGDDKPTLPAKVKELADDEISSRYNGFAYTLTICEGRFHQVKRMFEACGAKVLYLRRISMGGLALDEKLESGEYRKLTDEEVDLLRRR